MPYRIPAFCSYHAAREAGAANVTADSVASAGFLVARLYDSAKQRDFLWGTSQANNNITIDRGAGFATLPTINRLIIPHTSTDTLNTLNWEVRESTDDFAGSDVLVTSGTFAHAGLAVYDLALGPVTLRYVRLVVTDVSAARFGELFFTRTDTPSLGLDTQWTDGKRLALQEAEMRSGDTFRLNRGDSRLTWFVLWSGVQTATDKALFVDWDTFTNDGEFPFYFIPPDAAHAPTLVTVDIDGFARNQDHQAPAGAGADTAYNIIWPLTEVSS